MHIHTTKKFDKQFRKQSQKVQREFAKRIDIFMSSPTDPRLNIHKLSGSLQNAWSFNISGDVRVVFNKIGKETVILAAIGSHSELYG